MLTRLLLSTLLLAGSVTASEDSTGAFPLWDGTESIESYAERVKLPATKELDLGGGVMLKLVLVPAGKFTMGTVVTTSVLSAALPLSVGVLSVLALLAWAFFKKSPGRRFSFSLSWLLLFSIACALLLGGSVRMYLAREAVSRFQYADAAEHPAHTVTITNPYYMSATEVTQEQYQAVTGLNPSKFVGAQNPVESLSGVDTQGFFSRLQETRGVSAQLPTEAQWEFACRAGTTTVFHTGDTLAKTQANFNSPATGTVKCATFKPNFFGLYDMHGNVKEFCISPYADYPLDDQIDPTGPDKSTASVLRGGSWTCQLKNCRSAQRVFCDFGFSSDECGFRIVVPVARKRPRSKLVNFDLFNQI